MRHDMHHLSCDCTIAEFGPDCAEVLQAIRNLSSTTCSKCGGRITVRALELLDPASGLASLLTGRGATAYEASTPMPVATYLAAVNPERN